MVGLPLRMALEGGARLVIPVDTRTRSASQSSGGGAPGNHASIRHPLPTSGPNLVDISHFVHRSDGITHSIHLYGNGATCYC